MAFSKNQRRPRRRLPLLIAAILAVALLVSTLRIGPEPELTLETNLPGIGPESTVSAVAREPGRGLADLRLELIQDDRTVTLLEETHRPLPWWAPWGDRTAEANLETVVGWRHQEDLVEGEAVIRLTATRAGTWLRKPAPVSTEVLLPVRRTPPRIELLSRTVRVRQGGAAVVVYRAPEAALDGVQVGDRWYPGFDHGTGEPGARLAFFGLHHDLEPGTEPRLVAEDDLGNRSEQPFLAELRTRVFTEDTIRLSDGFIGRVVPAILAETPEIVGGETLLDSYLTINRDLRASNAETLVSLAAESRPEMLWQGAFDQLPNSRSMAPFADRRTYLYDGAPVDHQVHLGYDLASVRRAPVPAANDGVVVMARYFGIYGNTVVVDHGCGLMSLYSHLSEISVEAGVAVERGQTLGRTGQTGLAGGDHLHFSMLVHGTQVDPLEWWDPRWLENHILGPLGLAGSD